ncbi:UbiA prenyltransferase family-domain-containing protein [Aspergillus avenaceus]|uniref:UbiA prenyltransferase family-domain-containing protein n=1 Tax=Aspergillus avenaceus TaxID=36643 RepID=A0A5N6U0S1_ASPAV|nr:UbiA prenyltransferase family-domain-containing protein [Aspergillus avenaceus]
MSTTTTTKQCLTLSTPASQSGKPDRVVRKTRGSLGQFLQREYLITHLLLCDNIGEGIILPLVSLVARFLPAPHLLLTTPWPQLALILAKTLICFVGHLYVFEIVNQTLHVEEDRINKPFRPIPTGLLSMPGAYARWFLSWTLFPVAAGYLAGADAGYLLAAYQAWVFFCYGWPNFNHWLVRNAFPSVGAYNMFRLVDTIVQSEIPSFPVFSTRVLLVWAAWVISTIHMQEFHDVEGDRRSNRKSFPVAVGPKGEPVLRVGTALLFVGSGVFLLANAAASTGNESWVVGGLVVSGLVYTWLSCILGSRLVRQAGVEFDRKTYKLYYVLVSYSMVCYLSFWQVAK